MVSCIQGTEQGDLSNLSIAAAQSKVVGYESVDDIAVNRQRGHHQADDHDADQRREDARPGVPLQRQSDAPT